MRIQISEQKIADVHNDQCEADEFFAFDKIRIKATQKISQAQSKLIFDRILKCKVGKIIDWELAFNWFEIDPEHPEKFKKKIRDHFYNQTARIKRNAHRRFKALLLRICKKIVITQVNTQD